MMLAAHRVGFSPPQFVTSNADESVAIVSARLLTRRRTTDRS
jgi:hypothetical protein